MCITVGMYFDKGLQHTLGRMLSAELSASVVTPLKKLMLMLDASETSCAYNQNRRHQIELSEQSRNF